MNRLGSMHLIPKRKYSQPKNVFGVEFLNDVGLAAGFDKNAKILKWLPSFGFGFVEIGTVTPLPQDGNQKPRLFRDVAHQSIFNRMGFNNHGAIEISKRVELARKYLPKQFRIGLNIGKNKDTPLEDAHLDYAKALFPFEGLCDFIVINVSSPNTPGLRSLQTVEALNSIVHSVQEVNLKWASPLPVLLKLAPELSENEFEALIKHEKEWDLSAWVLTNTLAGKWKNSHELEGGWSGLRLQDRSRSALKWFRKGTELPLISVGGIDSFEEMDERRIMGANLLEIYSGWIFQGPNWVWKSHFRHKIEHHTMHYK